MRLSVVIPTLNEADNLGACLAGLADLRAAGHEVIVVDGGSTDGTSARAGGSVDRVLPSARGRAVQMNAGAGAAQGDALLFLHADTRLPAGADALVAAALSGGHRWGRFDVRLSGHRPVFRVIEWLMNVRSCVTGIATGDQALFVERALFDQAGGYPPIALMEDIAMSRRLKRMGGRPACVRVPAVTSSRRWERDGPLRTVLLMWRLRAAYALGADPASLAAIYYGATDGAPRPARSRPRAKGS